MKLDEVFTVNDIPVIVRREDKRYKPPLPPHGKMGVLDMLCKKASAMGYKMIGCFGSKYSNWIAGVPIIASKYNLKSVVCYPANKVSSTPKWVQHIEDIPYDGELWLIRPNMVTINQSQAKKYIEEKDGYFIPFGFDLPEVVELLSEQIELPPYIGTLVISCGSGITLSGVLKSIDKNKNTVKRIEAISSGREVSSIFKTIKKHHDVPRNINFRQPYGYADVPDIDCPWEAHDHFELKAYDWMYQNIKQLPQPIYFLNMGANSK